MDLFATLAVLVGATLLALILGALGGWWFTRTAVQDAYPFAEDEEEEEEDPDD